MDLVRGKQVLAPRTNRVRSAPKVLVHVVAAITDAVTHVQRCAAPIAHAALTRGYRVDYAIDARQTLKLKQIQAHAAAPASRAASTTAAAFGGRSSSGT